MTRRALLVPAIVLLAVLAACGGETSDGPEGDRETTTTSRTSPPADDATAAPSSLSCDEQTGGDEGAWHLSEVREAAHDGFDRVVFEFAPVEEDQPGVPRHVVREAEPPFTEDPSGLPVDVHADTALRVTFLNASGVDLSGTEPVVVYTGPREIVTDRTPVTSVVEAGDFENTMHWYVGLDARHCFAVGTLQDPPRIVVDVAHGEP